MQLPSSSTSRVDCLKSDLFTMTQLFNLRLEGTLDDGDTNLCSARFIPKTDERRKYLSIVCFFGPYRHDTGKEEGRSLIKIPLQFV